MTEEHQIFNIYKTYQLDDDDLSYSCSKDGIVTYLSFYGEKDWQGGFPVKDKIIEIATQFKQLKYLEIEVEGYCFTDLSALQELKYLEEIIIESNTSITNLTFLNSIPSLKRLTLNSSKITDLSPLYKYKKLSRLELPNAQISDVFKVHQFSDLKYLDLSNNKIEALENKPWPTELETIKLANNLIKNIEALRNCLQLKNVNLNSNFVTNLDAFKDLKNLKTLNVGNNPLINFPKLKNTKSVIELNIANIGLNNLSFLKDFCAVKELNIGYNKVKSLTNIEHFKHLQNLNIEGNKIEDISVLNRFKTSLTHLNCSKNPILNFTFIHTMEVLTAFNAAYIPIEYPNFNLPPSLRIVNLSHCKIKDISGINRLSGLDELNLSHNKIRSISTKNWILATYLNLSNNQIKEPIFVSDINHFALIDLRNNPFGNSLVADIHKGHHCTRLYLDLHYDSENIKENDLENKYKYTSNAIWYCLENNYTNAALAFYIQISGYYNKELDHLLLKIYLKKLQETPDGEYIYIKYYLYNLIQVSENISPYKPNNFKSYLSEEEVQIIACKLKSIGDKTLAQGLLELFNGEKSYEDIYINDIFPGYEILLKPKEDILPYFKDEYLYFLGFGSYIEDAFIEEDHIETGLYYLKQLYLINSPFYSILKSQLLFVLKKTYNKHIYCKETRNEPPTKSEY